MRAAPAFQVSLQRFGVWRCGVLLTAALGALALAMWAIARVPALDFGFGVAVALAGATWLWLVSSLARAPAVSLRWDGRAWHLGAPGSTGRESVPGELAVAIDLGTWMLLRFEPAQARWRVRPTWIPAQRRGIEPQWHALRCAVYAARAAADADAAIGR